MADFLSLKQTIQSYVKHNGNEEITGDILQDVLLAMVTTMGDGAINSLVTALQDELNARQNADAILQGNITAEANARGDADTALGGRIDGLQTAINGINTKLAEGYIYVGIATPSTSPGTPSGKVFYIAVQAGTYTNFGSISVTNGINILKYNGTVWSLDVVMTSDIDDIPTPGSNNPVKSNGIFVSDITTRLPMNYVNLLKKTVTAGTTVNQTFYCYLPAGKTYFRASISIPYLTTFYMFIVYVHYKGGSEVNLGGVIPGRILEYTFEAEVDYVRIYQNGTYLTWSGDYSLDAFTDMDERLTDTFEPRVIPIDCTINGYRNIADIGVAGRGEYSYDNTNTWKLSPIVNVGKGKVRAKHVVLPNVPWLFVYKLDGTHDWYISDEPNTAYTGTTNVVESTITLPQNVIAIQFLTRTTDAGHYQEYIPDTPEDMKRYVNNNIIDVSSKLTNLQLIYIQGNKQNVDSGYGSSDYIEVESGDYIEAALAVVCASNSHMPSGTVSTIGVGYYDKDKVIIGYDARTTTGKEKLYIYKKVPTRTKYICLCNITDDVPEPTVLIHRNNDSISSDSIESDSCIHMPLTYDTNGKEVVLFGDSITQGANASEYMNDSYAGILRKMFFAEHGMKMNYGFCHFAIATEPVEQISLVSNSGWTRLYENDTVLGGDRYETDEADSVLSFSIRKPCHYIKVASEFADGYGTITVEQGNNVLATISLDEDVTRIGTSELIDVSECDFNSPFIIRCVSGDVNVSGIVSIDNPDWWTFNNYGRSGAPATLFTGDLFDAQADNASVIFYALGGNSNWQNAYTAFESIKEQFKAVNAVKVVIDVYNYSSVKLPTFLQRKNLIRNLAYYVGAQYISVADHYPKKVNGDAIDGFYDSDDMHPTDKGHQFIAELIAKNIGLSVTSKGQAEQLVQ